MASTLGTTEATPLAPVAARGPPEGKSVKGPTRIGSIFPPRSSTQYFSSFHLCLLLLLVHPMGPVHLDVDRPEELQNLLRRAGADHRPAQHLIYAVITSGLKVVLGMALALLLTSKIIARGYLRSVVFFPVLVSTIGVGLTFTVLMNPEKGLINNALAVVGMTARAG